MSILGNPVLLSVILMCILCLLKVNVLISLLLSAIAAGLFAGMSIKEVMGILIGGMGGNSETALSYILLGALAFAIQSAGLASKLSNALKKVFGKNGTIFVLVLACIASLSQNLIPVHIAFIPILMPPLLGMMNDMKLDRRAAACSLTFGLKAPYIMLPIGFGLIFHGIIADAMTANGMAIDKMTVWKGALPPGLGMAAGLFIAVFISYRKKREYLNLPLMANANIVQKDAEGFTLQHWGALFGALAAFVIQLVFGSLPLGAVAGLGIMVATGAINYRDFDLTMNGGIVLMGFIAFVMLVASGYGSVIRETKGVEQLVGAVTGVLGGSRFLAVFFMLLIGLIVTMGIGTSFGTVPIIATIFVPLCIALDFSVLATASIIAAAGSLGDAGSPVSDSTLGPTAGLNADGQHSHIWDTCVPTFLHYNIPLFAAGIIAALIL